MCKKRIVQIVICFKPDVDELIAKKALMHEIPCMEITSEENELHSVVLHCSADKMELEKVFKTRLFAVKKRTSDTISHTVWENKKPFIIPDSLSAYLNYVIVYHPALTIS